MSQSGFPDGWDKDRVQRVLAHYEKQTKDEVLADDEADVDSSQTIMTVSRDLVQKVRELIAKHQS
jgi:glutamate formiminotransferase